MTKAQEQFFTRLNGLDESDRVALKRQAGIMLQKANMKSITAFYRCLPPFVKEWAESRWYAVACLRCQWSPGEESKKPLERIIAGLRSDDTISESTSHRVQILLDTNWDEDGYMLSKLARLVRLIRQKSDGEQPDFAALLKDLEYWNSDSQGIQRRWARAIFSQPAPSAKDEKD